MVRRSTLVSLTVVMIFTTSASAAVTELVVFGDSLSDTGNVLNATGNAFPPPPYFDGRFSNGPIWVEHLADELGIASPTPHTEGGTNFAYGGALSGTDPIAEAPFPALLTQIGAYTAASSPEADQLFIVWSGPNDFLLAGEDDPADTVGNIIAGLTSLASAGASQFLVPNMPRLTALPGASRPPSDFLLTPEDLGSRSASFNALLGTALDSFEDDNPDVDLYRFNAAGLLEDFLFDPTAYGFTNTTDPLIEAAPGTDPSEYLFWDTVHATSAAHTWLGQHAAVLIPEPTSALLLATVPLFFRRRR